MGPRSAGGSSTCPQRETIHVDDSCVQSVKNKQSVKHDQNMKQLGLGRLYKYPLPLRSTTASSQAVVYLSFGFFYKEGLDFIGFCEQQT